MNCPRCGEPTELQTNGLHRCTGCGKYWSKFEIASFERDALTAERDGYRAAAEERAAEVERLRGAMEEHETTIRALSRSDVERFKENNALAAEVTRQRKAARKFSAAHGYNGLVLARGLTSATVDPEDWAEFDAAFGFTPDSHECAGDYCEACDKGGGK